MPPKAFHFNPGQLVVVRKDLKEADQREHHEYYTTYTMELKAGQMVVIREAEVEEDYPEDPGRYRVEGFSDDYTWCDWMFEGPAEVRELDVKPADIAAMLKGRVADA